MGNYKKHAACACAAAVVLCCSPAVEAEPLGPLGGQYIEIQQPRNFDLVNNTLRVSGVAGGSFEAGFNYRVSDGHSQTTGHFMSGDGNGGIGQFQFTVNLAGKGFNRDRLTVEVFTVSPRDGREMDHRTVQVLYGPNIVPGYTAYELYTVQPGDTLFALANRFYGNGNLFHRIQAANFLVVPDANVLRAGLVLRVPRA